MSRNSKYQPWFNDSQTTRCQTQGSLLFLTSTVHINTVCSSHLSTSRKRNEISKVSKINKLTTYPNSSSKRLSLCPSTIHSLSHAKRMPASTHARKGGADYILRPLCHVHLKRKTTKMKQETLQNSGRKICALSTSRTNLRNKPRKRDTKAQADIRLTGLRIHQQC
jgi:hypothetical protein